VNPQIDVNGKGYLDFAEFLCLLFLWSGVGDYTNFFDRPENSKASLRHFPCADTTEDVCARLPSHPPEKSAQTGAWLSLISN
jgi:hypothetical protein